MNKPSFKKPHLNSLTGLRFFAAIYIVLFHHGNALCIFGSSVCNLISYGYISVSLFFILSGFVLSYVYLDTENIQPVNKRKFWIARFARIYPLYLLSLIVSFPSFASKIQDFVGSFIANLGVLFSAFLSLLLLQSWTPWTSTLWNTPAWAVSNEAFFYFIFPLVAIPLAQLNTKKIIISTALLQILALLPAFIYLISLKIEPSLGSSSLWLSFFAYSPFFHLPQFLIGVCIGLLYTKRTAGKLEFTFSLTKSFLFLGALYFFVSAVLTNSGFLYVLLTTGMLAPLFCIVIWYLAENKGRLSKFLASPKILILGEASYAIYLFQNPLLSFMKRIPIKLLGINPAALPFPDLIFLCLYMLMLILVSVFAAYYIESPLRKILINRLNK